VYPFPQPSSVDDRVYLFSPPNDVEGVSLSTINSVDMRVYSCLQSTVWTWGCFPFHYQECGCKGVSLYTTHSVDVQGVSLSPLAV
jgi:hypothetical protein